MHDATPFITTLPDAWVRGLGEALESLPPSARSRGFAYARDGRVSHVVAEPGRIRGSVLGGRRYRASIGWDEEFVRLLCTCPVGVDCKHTAALALVVLAMHPRVSDAAPRGIARLTAMLGATARAESASAPAEPAGAADPTATRLDPRLERIAARDPWFRRYQLEQLLDPDTRQRVRLGEPPFTQLFEERDPEILLWKLARAIADAGGRVPALLEPWRERPDLAAREQARERTAVADDLASWARRTRGETRRSLRAELSLDEGPSGPRALLRVLATSPGRPEAERSPMQLQSWRTELRRDRELLSPPQARLLGILTEGPIAAVSHTIGGWLVLDVAALQFLLDRFAGSPLLTWSPDIPESLARRGGVVPGRRAVVEAQPVTLQPAVGRDGEVLRMGLAIHGLGDGPVPLENGVFLASEDDHHSSVVLVDGVFHELAEEPPAALRRRFLTLGALELARDDGTRVLEPLARAFPSVRGALAPLTRVHRVRPVVTLDLGDDDWIEVRCFASGGDGAWTPGAPAPAGSTAFEFGDDGGWRTVAPSALAAGEERASIDGAADVVEAATAAAPDAASPPAEAPPSPWFEHPEPADVEPVIEWLAMLPLRGRERRGRDGASGRSGRWMRLDERNAERLAAAWAERPEDVTWLGNRAMRQLLAGVRTVRVRLRAGTSGVDWLAVTPEWEAEGLTLTEEDVRRLRAARSAFVKLPSGWVRRDAAEPFEAEAARLAEAGIDVGGGEQRVSLWQLALAGEGTLAMLTDRGADEQARAAMAAFRERVARFDGVPRVEPPPGLLAELRPYQRDGLDFLTFNASMGLGAVLADDMGLGKTVQALAWIAHRVAYEPEAGPTLVVCPASVAHNWEREAMRFTPGLRVLRLGAGAGRHDAWASVAEHDLVITTYALLRRDRERWAATPLGAAILDEAQNIKNPDAAVTRAALALDARHRLALTGTPLENRALDLWSILQFTSPGRLGTRRAFAGRYDGPGAGRHAHRALSARLRPFVLRRLKDQVARDLPPRIEERLDATMTPGQRRLYLAEWAAARAAVERMHLSPGPDAQRERFVILASLTRMRQICCHPALVGGRRDLGSGKFETLFELLEPLRAEGHKVLVFSQFVECIGLLREALAARGIGHHVLTGATVDRGRVVDAFEADPEPAPFLISLKAGGQGLNLTAASHVVLFDPWWNPAVEAQAIDRTHRIGQTKTVIAFRLVTEGSIEERMLELQEKKKALVRDVLGDEGFVQALGREDLEYLLAPPEGLDARV